jgi:hypothetical protein
VFAASTNAMSGVTNRNGLDHKARGGDLGITSDQNGEMFLTRGLAGVQ